MISEANFRLLECVKRLGEMSLVEYMEQPEALSWATRGSASQALIANAHLGYIEKFKKVTNQGGRLNHYKLTPEGAKILKEGKFAPVRKRRNPNTPKVEKAPEPETRLNLSETANTVLDEISHITAQNSDTRNLLDNFRVQAEGIIDTTKKFTKPTKPKSVNNTFLDSVNNLHYENDNLQYVLFQIHKLCKEVI